MHVSACNLDSANRGPMLRGQARIFQALHWLLASKRRAYLAGLEKQSNLGPLKHVLSLSSSTTKLNFAIPVFCYEAAILFFRLPRESCTLSHSFDTRHRPEFAPCDLSIAVEPDSTALHSLPK